MSIVGKKVVLNGIEEDDLPQLHKWANDAEINYQLGGWHFPTSMQDQYKWFEALSVDSLHQRFAIRVPEIGLIGMANLVNINWKDKNAFHGMMLGERDFRNKGYGMDTIMTIMRYAFEELGLERIDTSIIEYNEISLKTYVKNCGWIIEGKQRRWYYRKNKFWDKIIVGITRQDYLKCMEQTHYWSESSEKFRT